MSIEEKQNFQTFQDSSSTVYPKEEKEVSELIKQYYKSNIPIEIIGSGSKKKIGSKKVALPIKKNPFQKKKEMDPVAPNLSAITFLL